MFSNRDLRRLLIPLIVEQMLASLMGIADTMMVSNLGSAPVSGVSLVDSINKLVIFLFTAMATGGAIVCAQYLGRREKAGAERAARQVLLCCCAAGVLVLAVCLPLHRAILRMIFGSVERSVMENAETYFFITILSYPFTALFSACAAICRASGNSRRPMVVSVCCNLLNIAGNAVLMFVLRWGVTGAAISTTVSTALSGVILLILQRRPGQDVEIGPLAAIRPEWRTISQVLRVGIPTGVENAMFQFGKLIVQSTVSTLGTAAIASNAIVVVLELFGTVPSIAVGTGLMTVAGQCIGAGRPEQAKYYIRKLTLVSAGILVGMNWLVYATTGPVIRLAGMESEAARLTWQCMLWISILKPFTWPLAFTPVNGMRAAGDVRFAMLVSSVSMWVFRVGLTMLLCRVLGVGLIGIWCGYFADWTFRSVVYPIRYFSGKWLRHKVIESDE